MQPSWPPSSPDQLPPVACVRPFPAGTPGRLPDHVSGAINHFSLEAERLWGFAVGPAVLQTFPDTLHGLDRDEPLCRQVDEYIAGEDREAAHDKLLVPMMLHYDPVGRHEGFEAGIGKIALDKAQARRPLLNDRCGWSALGPWRGLDRKPQVGLWLPLAGLAFVTACRSDLSSSARVSFANCLPCTG